MASNKADIAKEKGNAAFKAGDYPTAIGHYTSAILIDRKNPTFPLNRAAAYLKLGKFEDAERDCTTVLSLDPSSVKALFRRGQARIGSQNKEGAREDLQRALRLDPKNDAAKQELDKIASIKSISKNDVKDRTIDIQLPIQNSASSNEPPKRRRIPIKIVEASSETPQTAVVSDHLTPISSRSLPTKDAPSLPPPNENAFSTKPNDFKQAKEARESAKTSRVGGGIFRAAGNHTLFKSKDVSSTNIPEVDQTTAKQEPKKSTSRVMAPPSVSVESLSPAKSSETSLTLFDFTRKWQGLSSSADRWALLRAIHPQFLASFFRSSLEAPLLSSILSVFRDILQEYPEASADVQGYMINFPRVPRFKTVTLLMDKAEKKIVEDIWGLIGGNSENRASWGLK